MAYDEILAMRVRSALADNNTEFEEKRMMGGLTFMVDNKMCVGIHTGDLMARIAPEEYEQALQRPGCKEMNFTGRPMKGFVFIDNEGTEKDEDLDYWVKLALEFNPRAKASKKRKKKP